MLPTQDDSDGSGSGSGSSRRQFLAYTALIAAGFTAVELAAFPVPAAMAAVRWFHPFTTRGTITSGFGPRTNPVTGQFQSLHDGIDYSPPLAGTPVRSVASGRVTRVQDYNDNGYGYHVIVAHADGFETLYGHMQAGSLQVVVGQSVGASAFLGRVGATGSSKGAHLHLRLHHNGKPLDPTSYVDGAPLAAGNEQPISNGRQEVQLIQSPTTIAIIGSNPGLGQANARTLGTNEQVNAAVKAWGSPVILTAREYDVVRALATNTPVN